MTFAQFTATVFSYLHFAGNSPDTPQNLGLNITSYVSIVVALIALIGTLIARKVKSPADELARADFAYKKIAERLDEVNKDRTYLQSVVDTLRAQVGKFDQDATISIEDRRSLRALVAEGEERIEQLKDENKILQERLAAIAEKVRLGQVITLADVYGEDNEPQRTPSLEEIELTAPPEKISGLSESRRRARNNQ